MGGEYNLLVSSLSSVNPLGMVVRLCYAQFSVSDICEIYFLSEKILNY